jgi:hypothetical protein
MAWRNDNDVRRSLRHPDLEDIMAAIDDLTAVVTEIDTDVANVLALVTTLNEQIATLEANPSDSAAVEAQVALLKQSAASIEAALPTPTAAGTPTAQQSNPPATS